MSRDASAELPPADGTPDATDRFTPWFGGYGLLNGDGTASGKAQTAFTLNGQGTNADRARFSFHQNGNTVFDPAGAPRWTCSTRQPTPVTSRQEQPP
jgi:hypothetical protein